MNRRNVVKVGVGFQKREVNNLMEKEEGGLCNGSEAELVCQRREQSAFMEETDSKLGLLE